MAPYKKFKKIISIFTVLFVLFSTLFIYYAPIYTLSSDIPQKPAALSLGGISMGQFICVPNNTFDIQNNFKTCPIHFLINTSCIIDKPKISFCAFFDKTSDAKVFDSLEITSNAQKSDGKK